VEEKERGRHPSCNGRYSRQFCLGPMRCDCIGRGGGMSNRCRHISSLRRRSVSCLERLWLFLSRVEQEC